MKSLRLPIEPHVGIGPVKLGMTREAARLTLREKGVSLSASDETVDYFCDNALQIEYDAGTVSFVGVSRHERLVCTYQGVNVFDVPAQTLFETISNGETVQHPYAATEFVFPGQIVTVWAPHDEYAHGGHRHVYAQVGLGDRRYLVAVNDTTGQV